MYGDPEDPGSLTPNNFMQGGFDASPTMRALFDDSEDSKKAMQNFTTITQQIRDSMD